MIKEDKFILLLLFTNPCFLNLFNNIVNTVKQCVLQYFVTFRFCWEKILIALCYLIQGYYDLLSNLINKILCFPNILICSITAILLIKIVFNVIL